MWRRDVGGGFAVVTGDWTEMALRCVLSCRFRSDGAVFWAAVRPGQELSGD